MNWEQTGECIDGDNGCGYKKNFQPVCLSHDGNRVAIGAFLGREGPATVKVLDFDGVKWNEVGRFSGSKTDFFGCGRTVALSGNGTRLAIGVPRALGLASWLRGYVQVYEHKEGTVWEPLGLIMGKHNDHFGWNVSMSKDGNRIAVSSNRDHSVFELDRDLKRRIVKAIVGEADWSALILEFLGCNWNQVARSLVRGAVGCSALSADGNVVAVGLQDHNTSRGSYSVQVFQYASKIESKMSMQSKRDWVQLGKRLHSKEARLMFRENFSINAEGNLLALGAKRTVDIFQLKYNNWNFMGKISECGLHSSVCLAPNANKIAVSVEDQNGNSVKVFSYNGYEWVLEANLMLPSDERGNEHSVSLSSSGDGLAVGSIEYGRVGRGRIRNYNFG